ncbi:MAG: DUF3450 domain-containing protein [Pseudohongiellaceae bacterium]
MRHITHRQPPPTTGRFAPGLIKACFSILCTAGLLGLAGKAQAAEINVDASIIDRALEVVEQKFNATAQQQEEIVRLANANSALFDEFQQENDNLEAWLVLNAETRGKIVRQEQLITQLDESIAEVEAITREMPLLTEKMLTAITQFIERDFPFQLERRRAQVAFARDAITNPQVSIAERFRQVLVLYQAEAAAGRTNETYPDTITFEGVEIDVNILRIGRIALIFQTTDRRVTGVWNNELGPNRGWVELPAGRYRTAVQRAIRIASQLDAPDIIELPVKAPESAQ